MRSLLASAQERALFLSAICNLPSSGAKDIVNDPGFSELLLIIACEPDIEQRMTDAFVEIAERVRSNVTPLDVALQEVDALVLQPDCRALARSQLLFGCGHFKAVWQMVTPHMESYQNEYSGIYLHLGSSALAALRREEATKRLDAEVEARSPRSTICTLLRHLLTGRITRAALIDLRKNAGEATPLDDMASQFHPLKLISAYRPREVKGESLFLAYMSNIAIFMGYENND